jgi:hypothetical protein
VDAQQVHPTTPDVPAFGLSTPKSDLILAGIARIEVKLAGYDALLALRQTLIVMAASATTNGHQVVVTHRTWMAFLQAAEAALQLKDTA